MPKQKTPKAVNYNEVLNFTNDNIICGQREISWADFGTYWNSSDKCLLKNGESITIGDLWVYLLADYSFKMSPKLIEL